MVAAAAGSGAEARSVRGSRVARAARRGRVARADRSSEACSSAPAAHGRAMIALDTNVLFPALEPSHRNHSRARAFVDGAPPGEIVVCELVLVEIYVLVRKPGGLSSSSGCVASDRARSSIAHQPGVAPDRLPRRADGAGVAGVGRARLRASTCARRSPRDHPAPPWRARAGHGQREGLRGSGPLASMGSVRAMTPRGSATSRPMAVQHRAMIGGACSAHGSKASSSW